MNQIKLIFEDIDPKLLTDLFREMDDFKYIDPINKPVSTAPGYYFAPKSLKENLKPEFLDPTGPVSYYTANWRQYFMKATMHGFPRNHNAQDTSNERRRCISNLTKSLNRIPTGEDFKKAFELSHKFDEICRIIGEDIKKLMTSI